ncbi:MAG: T9SS type A sorting domain-containing protein [Flavobacteriales bacterium]|nr:T9SS type A sorting domain-containing protein [Flavobacteriales bacterium]MCB9447777.1 T9SS type A sorting domain-containing protein [Flavobacteriales bacterium]
MKKLLILSAASLLWLGNAWSTTYYVNTAGSNSNSGLSEGNAWRTITFAAGYNSPVRPGDIVYVKAGNYGAEYVSFIQNGTSGSPITFEGYTNVPGDAPDLNFSMGDALDASVMPLLDGGNRANGKIGMNLAGGHSYIVIKNFQITNYSYGVNSGTAHHITLDNVITTSTGDINDSYSGRGIQFGSWSTAVSSYNTVRNCIVVNSAAEGLSINGDFNTVFNCKVYCNEGEIGSGNNAATDYYLLVDGNNNTIEACYVERIGDLAHYGHGIGAKWDCQNNYFLNCTAVNMTEDFYVRHRGAKFNTFKGCHAITGRAFVVRDGASYNHFIDCRADDVKSGFRFMDTSEDGGAQYAGRHNTFENCIINSAYLGIHFDDYDQVSIADSNTFAYCTFNNIDYLFYCGRQNANNQMISCIVANSGSLKGGSYALSFACSYTNFYANKFSTPSGSGNISTDPLFVDEASGNFHLQPGSPCIDKGVPALNVSNDFDGTQRPYGSGYDMGAYEYAPVQPFSVKENTTNVKCNGGSDGTATVIASGGTIPYTYSWNNGQATPSISGLKAGKYTVTVTDAKSLVSSITITVTEPTAISVTNINKTDVTYCGLSNDGAMQANITGGVAPYSYEWNTAPVQNSATATGLGSGAYTLVVTDANGCTRSFTDSVPCTPPVDLTYSHTNAKCNGSNDGTASVNVTGGYPPYTYIWTDGQTTATATGLKAGSYRVTVSDSKYGGYLQTVNVNEPAAIVVEDMIRNEVSSCDANDGSLQIAISGGKPGYTYLWNTVPAQTTSKATGLTTGTYTVVVTDASGCSIEVSETLSCASPFAVTYEQTDVKCNGGSDGNATVNANGGAAPYSYQWSNGESTQSVSGLSAGNYVVTVTDAVGANVIENIYISEPDALLIDSVSHKDASDCNISDGELEVHMSGGVPAYSYEWNTNPTQYGSVATGLLPGMYTAIVTDANGCVTEVTDSVGCPPPVTGTDDNNSTGMFRVYPNPTHGVVHIKGSDMQSVYLTTLTGTVVTRVEPNNPTRVTLDLDALGLPPGYYLLFIQQSDRTISDKIVLR